LSKIGFGCDSPRLEITESQAGFPMQIKRSRPQVGLMRTPIRKRQKCPTNGPAMVQSVRWAKWFACAIRSTGSSWLGRRAWSVAGRGRIRITSRLRNLARLDTESAMNSPSRFVESITGNFIAQETKPRGGGSSTSIRFQSRSGFGSIREWTANSAHHGKASHRRRLRKHLTSQRKIKPAQILIRAPQLAGLIQNSPDGLANDDLVSTDRGQSTQCAAQHRPKNRRWQTSIAAQRSPTWIDGRDRYSPRGRYSGLPIIRSSQWRACRAAS